jgi:hypothetical protein
VLAHYHFGVVNTLWNAILTVVLLSIDRVAFAVKLSFEPRAFTRADASTSHSREPFVSSDSRQSRFEPDCFSSSQLAASDPLVDSLSFAVFATVYSARSRHRYRARTK